MASEALTTQMNGSFYLTAKGKENVLFQKLSEKYKVPNPLELNKTTKADISIGPHISAKPQVDDTSDYQTLLTQFYQTHNPSKVSEVMKNLTKYKVRIIKSYIR